MSVDGCVIGMGLLGEEDAGDEAGFTLTKALGMFVALEPSVDAGLGRAGLLHVGDDLGACVGFGTVGNEFVEIAVEDAHGLKAV
jgi:hypothetical protein